MFLIFKLFKIQFIPHTKDAGFSCIYLINDLNASMRVFKFLLGIS